MALSFKRERMVARFRSPDGSSEELRQLEVRFDPLLGTSSRIVEGVRLATGNPQALRPLQDPDPECPFCAARLERMTPQIPPSISEEPRLHRGETVLFPNLVPYSQYSAVALFSSRHWLSLADFTPDLILDNLRAGLDYIRSVYALDSKANFCSYNVNYLYPSGGSLPHPHSQIYLDPLPTTMLRVQLHYSERFLTEEGRSCWEDLLDEEARRQERSVFRTGEQVHWFTPFAPIGFNEVRAAVSGRTCFLELDEDDLLALSLGIKRVLSWYDSIGYNSFNLALFSGPLDGTADGFRVNLSMVTRSALLPYYRSDAMYLERLHWEAAVDRSPEEVASQLREAACLP